MKYLILFIVYFLIPFSFASKSTEFLSHTDVFRVLRQKFPTAFKSHLETQYYSDCVSVRPENMALLGFKVGVNKNMSENILKPAFLKWYLGCVTQFLNIQKQQLTSGSEEDRERVKEIIFTSVLQTNSSRNLNSLKWCDLSDSEKRSFITNQWNYMIGPHSPLAAAEVTHMFNQLNKKFQTNCTLIVDVSSEHLFLLSQIPEFFSYK